MTPTLFGVVLVAALLHAVWNALVKSGRDRLLTLAVVNACSGLVGVIMAATSAMPASASWPWLLSSALLHCGYYFFLLQAYRVGDLSHVYPLARGGAPLLVTIGAAQLADEHLSSIALLGVGVACIGIISLAFEGGPPWRRDARALWFALSTSVFIAAYTITDGIGVRRADTPTGYIGWLFLIDGIPLTLMALHLRRGRVMEFLAHHGWRCAAGGIASMTAYGLVIWAMSLGSMGMVSALRETSVLFATAIGVLILGERLTVPRVMAAVLVCGGVMLMHLAD